MTTVLAVDTGCDGCFLLLRNVGNGPELCCEPYTWHYGNSNRYEKHVADLQAHFLYLLDAWKPRAIALEKPVSILGRRGVGVSQALKAARWQLLAEQHGVGVLWVPGQSKRQPAAAAAILRQSLSELVTRERLAELSGPKGEHYFDSCAIGITALGRKEGEKDE